MRGTLRPTFALLTAACLGAAALWITEPAEAAAGDVAALAVANQGRTACGEDSLGNAGFESSCTGNGGQPEYWCADFVRWVWQNSGLAVTGLTPAAASFITSGDGTVHTSPAYQPHVGDAVVYNYDGADWAQHVGIVTDILPGGAVETENGDFGSSGSTEAQFAAASTVQETTLPAGQTSVGSVPAGTGMTISAYVTPPDLGTIPGQPAPDAVTPTTAPAPHPAASAHTSVIQVPGLSSLSSQEQAGSAPVTAPPSAALTAAGTVTIPDTAPPAAAPRRAAISVAGWTTPAAAPLTPRAAANSAAVPVSTPVGATTSFWAGPPPARNLYRAAYIPEHSIPASVDNLGGHLASPPIALTTAGSTALLYQGTDGYLYLTRGSRWTSTRITGAGRAARLTLTAAIGPERTITAAWTTPGHRLAEAVIYADGKATTTIDRHGLVRTAPALAASSRGITAYYQGSGGTLWAASQSAAGAIDAANLRLPMGNLAGGQLAATATAEGTTSVFWTIPGLSANLIQARISPAGHLAAVADLGGSLASAPAVFNSVPGTTEVLYWGTDGNLCQTTSTSSGTSWTTPVDLGRGRVPVIARKPGQQRRSA